MEKNKWSNVKLRALSSLGYFDNLDKQQLKTVCRLAVMRQYKPLETIYNEDKGLLTYVHFVISGECMILQCLRMKVTSKKGKERIFQLEIIKKEEDDLFYKIENVDLMNITKKRIRTLYRKNNQIDTKDLVITNLIMDFEKEDVEECCVKIDERLQFADFLNSDTKIENHFIDVGSLTFGGIFGLGELLEHRVIMARTTVQCILIPRFFLFEKANNPDGIWNRRRFYIECNIPSRKQLFENFLTTRKWQKFKNDLIEKNLGSALKCNPTKVEDIPIMCRIVEDNEIISVFK